MSAEAPSPIVDNDSEWVKKQIEEYLATDGAKPVFRYGAPLVLLTTKGRKSGEWRRTCLIGAEFQAGVGDEYLLVASLGGAPKHPVWYLNLRDNPRVWLQVGAEAFWAVARTATAEEKPPRWERMVELYPDYADYQVKTDREIPIVILEREH
jgi:deazaflavin-dependent oxidoreductase (nitroreductase family)